MEKLEGGRESPFSRGSPPEFQEASSPTRRNAQKTNFSADKIIRFPGDPPVNSLVRHARGFQKAATHFPTVVSSDHTMTHRSTSVYPSIPSRSLIFIKKPRPWYSYLRLNLDIDYPIILIAFSPILPKSFFQNFLLIGPVSGVLRVIKECHYRDIRGW